MGVDDIQVEGQWVWNHGLPFPAFPDTSGLWAWGEPDGDDVEDCGSVVVGNNEVSDVACGWTLTFFCQEIGPCKCNHF